MTGEGLRGQSVELFSRAKALLDSTCELPFVQHVHQFNANQGAARRVKGLEAQHWSGHAFHCAMVLLDYIIEIFHLPNDDRRAVLLIGAANGRSIGLAPINGNLLRDPMAADRFCQLVEAETLIERIDSLSCPFLSPKQPTPCP